MLERRLGPVGWLVSTGVFFGVVSGVKLWTDECYVFRAVLGSLVAVMRVAGGPGGK